MCVDVVREVLKLDATMRELAMELVNEQSLLVFGRGYNYATALEAALKVSTSGCKSQRHSGPTNPPRLD